MSLQQFLKADGFNRQPVMDEAGKRLPVTTYGPSGTAISSTEGEGNLVDLSGATVANGSLTINANGEFAIIDTAGAGGLALTVSGFGTATLAVQWSNLAASGFVAGLVGTVGTTSTATTITADGQYTAASGGRYAKIITTAYTSGTLVVTPVLVDGGASSASAGGGDVNLTEIGGSAVDVGNGVVGSATLRVAVASNSGMPLPTGAATAALQSLVQNTFGAITAERSVLYDASGNAVSWTDTVVTEGEGVAGTPAGGVLSIQGVAGGTAVPVSGTFSSTGPTADDAAATGNPVQVAGKYTSTAPTFADGDTAQLRVTPKGDLNIGGRTADDAAAPAAADTYPVVAGGIYRATLPAYTDGDRAQMHYGVGGQLITYAWGSVTTAAPTYTNATIRELNLSTTGGLRVENQTGAGAAILYNSTNGDNMVAASGITTQVVNAVNRLWDGSTNFARAKQISGAVSTGIGTAAIERAPSTIAAAAIAPVATSAAANKAILKGSGANVHSINAVSGASAGVVFLFNATDIPSNGTVTPVKAWILGAASSLSVAFDPPLRLGTGATLAFGTGTDPFSLTASATAFLSGEAI